MRSRATFRVGQRTPEAVVAAASGDSLDEEAAFAEVMELASRPLDFAATVPESEHYRPATVMGQSCGTCRYFTGTNCTMFPGRPAVQADYVCDSWNSDEDDAQDDADA